MSGLERIVYVVLAAGLAVGLGASILAPELYVATLAAEDGPFEWATAAFLFVGALACLARAVRGRDRLIFLAVSLFGAALLMFGAGEEISWGQRVFGWDSGEFWEQNNVQGETNLHNMMVGDVKINKLIFGVGLTLAFLVYFVVLPLVYHRIAAVAGWANCWGVPVPKWHHGVAFVVSLIVMSLIPTSRSAELGEFAIGLLLALVVLRPANTGLLR